MRRNWQGEVITRGDPTVIRDLYISGLKLLGVINPVPGRPFSPSCTVVKILSFPRRERRLIFDPCRDSLSRRAF